jgi:hypothetical protein
MHFLQVACLFFAASAAFAEAPKASVVSGTLTQPEGAPPAIRTEDGKLVALGGDADTLGVLNDKRLRGAHLEVKGHLQGGLFAVDPIHTDAMHVYKDGKRLIITYWCDLCAIRTYTPGICWCCQKNTELDLREKL